MKIYVRRRHIKEGKRFSSRECPIALACIELLGGRVNVSPWYVRTSNGRRHVLPPEAECFIDRFDSGKPVKPFAFTIRA